MLVQGSPNIYSHPRLHLSAKSQTTGGVGSGGNDRGIAERAEEVKVFD